MAENDVFALDGADKIIMDEVSEESVTQLDTVTLQKERLKLRKKERKAIHNRRLESRLEGEGFFTRLGDEIWVRLAEKGKIATVMGVGVSLVFDVIAAFWFSMLVSQLGLATVLESETIVRQIVWVMAILGVANVVGMFWVMLPSILILAAQSKFGGFRLIAKD